MSPKTSSGWFGLACFNALSHEQQRMLIEDGVLPFGRKWPEGAGCERGASVAIEVEGDEAPGPRFYCVPCGIEYLRTVTIDTDT